MDDSPPPPASSPPFVRIGPDTPRSPVVISVPHAGRDYAPALLASARLPRAKLELLEDPLVDRLVWRAVADGATAFVARRPRAEIDLNRDPCEIEPAMVSPPPARGLLATARTRGGLGLIPSRLAGLGPLWHGPLPLHEVERRIAEVHRPYHAALADTLERTRAAFGIAILLDCHSMPPRAGPHAAPVVLGDRHGRAVAPDLVDAAQRAALAAGHRAARNDPYAGGYVTAAHGRPAAGVHAMQLEIDRTLYLAADLRTPGPGFAAVAAMVAAIAAALADCALGREQAIAAE